MKITRLIALLGFLGSTSLVHATECPDINYENDIKPVIMNSPHSVILNGVTWSFRFEPSFNLGAMVVSLKKITPMEMQGALDAGCKYRLTYTDAAGTQKDDVELILERPLSPQENAPADISQNTVSQEQSLVTDTHIQTVESLK